MRGSIRPALEQNLVANMNKSQPLRSSRRPSTAKRRRSRIVSASLYPISLVLANLRRSITSPCMRKRHRSASGRRLRTCRILHCKLTVGNVHMLWQALAHISHIFSREYGRCAWYNLVFFSGGCGSVPHAEVVLGAVSGQPMLLLALRLHIKQVIHRWNRKHSPTTSLRSP